MCCEKNKGDQKEVVRSGKLMSAWWFASGFLKSSCLKLDYQLPKIVIWLQVTVIIPFAHKYTAVTT